MSSVTHRKGQSSTDRTEKLPNIAIFGTGSNLGICDNERQVNRGNIVPACVKRRLPHQCRRVLLGICGEMYDAVREYMSK